MIDGCLRRAAFVAIALASTSCSDAGDDNPSDGHGAHNGSGGSGASGGSVSGGMGAGGAGGSAGGVGGAGGSVGGAGGSVGGAGGNGGSSGGTGAGGDGASGGAGGDAGAGPGGAGGQGGSDGSGGVAGSGGSAGTGAGGTGGGGGDCFLPPVTSVDMAGPYAVTVDQMAGANSWVFRPTELGKDGVKHPIFVWGTGATALPSRYVDHLTRIASHGFVAISPNSSSVSAALLKASLDWIIAQNSAQGSVYFGKLNVKKVAMGGHSLGSVGTFNQEATETRLTTTIHIAGGSMDGAGSSKVKTPTAYICGETDIALANCQRDFERVGTQPTFFSELKGIDHVGAARSALPGMVAWLRWHLACETDRKAMFTGPSGQFFTGIWQSQTKNW